MSERFYPNITEDQIHLINSVFRKTAEDENYLTSPQCPYPEVVKQFFNKQITTAAGTVNLFEGDESEALDAQIKQVINDLEQYGKSLSSEDTSEKLQYFKTKTALLEKLLTMRERTFNIKEIHVFRTTIMQFLSEVCTADQITDIMTRLDGVLSDG